MSQAKKAPRADGYWALALKNVRDPKMLAFASLIIALRVAVKAFRIPLAAGLSLNFDCYINALGSVVYGPLAALLVGWRWPGRGEWWRCWSTCSPSWT